MCIGATNAKLVQHICGPFHVDYSLLDLLVTNTLAAPHLQTLDLNTVGNDEESHASELQKIAKRVTESHHTLAKVIKKPGSVDSLLIVAGG